jgi:hypothetical protein
VGWLFGWILLSWGVLRSIVLRPFRRNALQQFSDHYSGEGIGSLEARDLAILHQSTGCIACGRCDGSVRMGREFSMMGFALFAARHLSDYDAVRRSIQDVEDGEFRQAEALCPVGVPLLALSSLIRKWPDPPPVA